MRPPPLIAGRLLAEGRSRPLFSPQALRWIITELAAAGPGDLADVSNVKTEPTSLLAAAWFPRSFQLGHPDSAELLTAAWMLQDSFDGDGQIAADGEGVLAFIASLGYATQQSGHWLPKLAQWTLTWEVPDSHPSVSAASGSLRRCADYSRRSSV
jgi:hypothetical protein